MTMTVTNCDYRVRAPQSGAGPGRPADEHEGRYDAAVTVTVTVPSPSRSQALDRADQLMNMKGGMMRLDTVWGVGGARRPVRTLVKQMTLLLKEFLTSSDTDEVIR